MKTKYNNKLLNLFKISKYNLQALKKYLKIRHRHCNILMKNKIINNNNKLNLKRKNNLYIKHSLKKNNLIKILFNKISICNNKI